MKSNLRRLKKEEFPRIKNFVERVYYKNYTLSNKAHYDWLFDNFLNESEEEYTAIGAFNKKGELVGHLAWIPVVFYCLGKEIKGLSTQNLIVDEKLRTLGYGVLLMEYVEKQGRDMGISLNIGKNGGRLIEAVGWKIQDLSRYVFVIDEGKAQTLINNDQCIINRHTCVPGTLDDLVSFEEVVVFQDDVLDFADSLKNKYPITVKRTKEYLNWRYITHPLLKYHCFLTRGEGGRIRSLLVIRIEEVENYKIGRIVDFISDDFTETITLVKGIGFCREKGVDVVDFFCTGNFHLQSLLNAGFEKADRAPLSLVPIVFNPIDRMRKLINYSYKFFDVGIAGEKHHDVDDWYITKGDADGDRAN